MKTLCILLLAVSPAFAGALRFSGQHIAKPAAKVSAKAVVKSAHGAVKAVKVAKRAAY